MSVCADLNITCPSHSTIIVWTKKFGLYHIEKKKEKSDDWVVILDESIAFGNEKLLVVLGIRGRDIDYTKALQYQDLECLSLKISSSWKAEDIKKVIDDIKSEVGHIEYAIADMGNAIRKSLVLCNIPHVEDLAHKLSWMIKQIYEKDADFISYTKELARLRKTMALSKESYILPPAQRVHSRFMNLKPIVCWGLSVIRILKGTEQLIRERELLAGILKYGTFLNELSEIVRAALYLQKTIKNGGLSSKTIKESLKYLKNLSNKTKVKSFKLAFVSYLNRMKRIGENQEHNHILCSSDILESSFGKYKNYINSNKSIGITALSLTIPAFINDYKDSGIVMKAMNSITVKDVDCWSKNNIKNSLLKKRKKVFKQTG